MQGPSDRSTAFDVLRAVAVLMVLGRHIEDTRGLAAPVEWLVARWSECGWMGVDLFFVLSGFLVSGLLYAEHEKHGALRPGHFLARRGFKIYPSFYLLLGITWLWRGDRIPTSRFVHEALFVQNYLDGTWIHTWSLAVEEHFYFGLALLLWLAVRFAKRGDDPFRRLPAFTLFIVALCLGMRIVTFRANPAGHLLFPTHLRIDALLFGAMLSYLWRRHRERVRAFVAGRRVLLFGGSVVLLIPCLVLPLEGNAFVNTIGLTCNLLGFGGLTLLAAAAEPRPAGKLWPLARIGYCSYSIYLWHRPVWALTETLVAKPFGNAAGIAAFLVFSVLFGIAATALIEQPFLNLRDRLLPSRAR